MLLLAELNYIQRCTMSVSFRIEEEKKTLNVPTLLSNFCICGFNLFCEYL